MLEQTFTMIKPDSVERGETGRILARMETAGLVIKRLKMLHLSPEEARQFYHMHAGKPFFEHLVAYISAGPVCAVVLEKEDAIRELRALVGATDPAEADEGTIRREFGLDNRRNAVHASDAPETAREEIAFFGLTLSREA
ncbi:MAG: nucleoside-diphosphate kinase [Candidatus Eisenbacteria sp.]|nr:nucleoside-diphosphate kinase [Candidatus Eisenbacteria bacterium]